MYSRPSLITDSETLQTQEELRKIRVILISAAVSYPIWWILMRFLSPEAYDPLWQRLIFSSISLTFFAISFTWRDFDKYVKYFYLTAWLYSYHLLFLYWKNADNVFYIICNIIQYPYLILSFPTWRMAQVYALAKIAVVFIMSFFIPHELINPWFVVLAFVTTGHYLLVSTKNHFNVLNGLKRSNETIGLTLSNMLEGVVVLDEKGQIMAYNPMAEHLLGFNGSEQIGKSFRETSLFQNTRKENLLPYKEEQHPIVQAYKEKSSCKNKVMGLTLENQTHRWLQLNLQPIDMGGFTHLLVSFADLSVIKEKQHAQSVEQANMAMNARLSSLFAISGGISHEINNPLVIIKANVHSLKRKLETAPFDHAAVKEVVEKINRAVKRMTTIVEGLKTLSRSGEETLTEVVSLNEIIQNTLELTQENIKQQKIEFVIDAVPEVKIDCRPQQIMLVLYNLLMNATDAVNGQSLKWIRIRFETVGKRVLIKIIDSGPAMSEEVKLRMMEPFFTTKEVGKGTGLGLSVSKAIVEDHGGELYRDDKAAHTTMVVALSFFPMI